MLSYLKGRFEQDFYRNRRSNSHKHNVRLLRPVCNNRYNPQRDGARNDRRFVKVFTENNDIAIKILFFASDL